MHKSIPPEYDKSNTKQIYLWMTIYIYIYTRGAYDKFPDFFRMGTFIDSTHMKL